MFKRITIFVVILFSLALFCQATVNSEPSTNQFSADFCDITTTPISHIQGSNRFSPLAGQQVITRGIVTQVSSDGFWVQSDIADQDDNPQTSEGLFIYSAASAVRPGLFVSLSGKVVEKHQQTQLVAIQKIQVCGEKTVPAAIDIDLPLFPKKRWESLEGMQIRLSNSNSASPVSVITGFNGRGKGYLKYREVVVSRQLHFQPSQSYRPESTQARQQHRLYLQDQLLVSLADINSGEKKTLNIGNTFTSLSGVVHSFAKKDKKGKWWPRIIADRAVLRRADEKQTGVTLTYPATTNLLVASFNMQNYFNGRGKISSAGVGNLSHSRGAKTAAQFRRQTQKLVAAVKAINADILVLNEVENDGDGDDSAIAYFVRQLNQHQAGSFSAAPDNHYDWVRGGNSGSDKIRNVIIYRPQRVALAGPLAVVSGKSSARDKQGKRLFDDYGNRPVLLQRFLVRGKTLLVAAVHLKSKGSSCKESRAEKNGGGSCNHKRTRAATAIAEAIHDYVPTADFQLVMGDFNSYGQEDPLKVFYRQGWRNAASFSTSGNSQPNFSYRFRGRLGALDHILLNKALVNKVQGFFSWHINSVQPDTLSYRQQSSEHNIPSLEKDKLADYLRSSDHDPQILALRI